MIQVTDNEMTIGKKVTFHCIQEDIINIIEELIKRYPDNNSLKEAYNKIVDISTVEDFENIYEIISNNYDNPYWNSDRLYHGIVYGDLSRMLNINI